MSLCLERSDDQSREKSQNSLLNFLDCVSFAQLSMPTLKKACPLCSHELQETKFLSLSSVQMIIQFNNGAFFLSFPFYHTSQASFALQLFSFYHHYQNPFLTQPPQLQSARKFKWACLFWLFHCFYYQPFSALALLLSLQMVNLIFHSSPVTVL